MKVVVAVQLCPRACAQYTPQSHHRKEVPSSVKSLLLPVVLSVFFCFSHLWVSPCFFREEENKSNKKISNCGPAECITSPCSIDDLPPRFTKWMTIARGERNVFFCFCDEFGTIVTPPLSQPHYSLSLVCLRNFFSPQ